MLLLVNMSFDVGELLDITVLLLVSTLFSVRVLLNISALLVVSTLKDVHNAALSPSACCC